MILLRFFIMVTIFSTSIYFTAHAGFSGWICFFVSWGILEWAGILFDAVVKTIRER